MMCVYLNCCRCCRRLWFSNCCSCCNSGNLFKCNEGLVMYLAYLQPFSNPTTDWSVIFSRLFLIGGGGGGDADTV